MWFQLKDHGKAGLVGQPAPILVEWGLEIDQGSTMLGYLALGVQQIPRIAKVMLFRPLYPLLCCQCDLLSLVEGAWTSWGGWTSCSTSCGQGSKSRSRGHSAGLPCSGSDTDTGTCQGRLKYIFYQNCLV